MNHTMLRDFFLVAPLIYEAAGDAVFLAEPHLVEIMIGFELGEVSESLDVLRFATLHEIKLLVFNPVDIGLNLGEMLAADEGTSRDEESARLETGAALRRS